MLHFCSQNFPRFITLVATNLFSIDVALSFQESQMNQFVQYDDFWDWLVSCIIFWDSSIWLHVSIVTSFLFLSIFHIYIFPQFNSVAQLCPALCDSMNCSTPGIPVHHQLLKFNKLMSIRLVMPSTHLNLCHLLLFLPSIFPSIRVFSRRSKAIQGKVLRREKGRKSQEPC